MIMHEPWQCLTLCTVKMHIMNEYVFVKIMFLEQSSVNVKEYGERRRSVHSMKLVDFGYLYKHFHCHFFVKNLPSVIVTLPNT